MQKQKNVCAKNSSGQQKKPEINDSMSKSPLRILICGHRRKKKQLGDFLKAISSDGRNAPDASDADG